MSYSRETAEQRHRRWKKANAEVCGEGPADRAVIINKKAPLARALHAQGVGPMSIAVRLSVPHIVVLSWLTGQRKFDRAKVAARRWDAFSW